MNDQVNHPPHYQSASPIGRPILRAIGISETAFDWECIDLIESIEHLAGFGFCRLNAIKYLWRAGQKGDPVKDLLKAKWYLERGIENDPCRDDFEQAIHLIEVEIERRTNG